MRQAATPDLLALLQDSPALTFSAGLELIDRNLNLIEDISDELESGEVTRSSYATLHGTSELKISRELDWGQIIVRPYQTITNGEDTQRFNMGAYYTSTPNLEYGESPQVFSVTGYDILHGLNDPVGESYVIDTTMTYVAVIEEILMYRGFTKYVIDQSKSNVIPPSTRVWPIDSKITWLTIINDLLAAIGYQGLWSDWDGWFHANPYQNPRDKNIEWTYDTGLKTAMLGENRILEKDFFDAPNRWVAVRSNNIEGSTPVEGDGIYTYVNGNNGPTSVEARDRVITKMMSFDAADQSSLATQASIAIESDLRLITQVKVRTSINPLHWHFDKLRVNDPSLGILDVVDTKWTLSLTGDDDMNHEWTVL